MKFRSPYALWLALGLVFALAGVGFDSPDEHFPTLEAAGQFLFGRFDATWEWEQGLRSFFQPLLLAAWLKPFVALGLENRLWLDSLARVFNVLWFLPAIWAAGELSGKKAQWWLAASWPLVVWGTRHGSDTFGIPLMLAGFALFLVRGRPLLAGLLLGAAFEARFTTGVFSVLGVAVATFATRQTKLRSALLAGAGFVAAAGVLEALDWLVYAWLDGSGKIPAWKFFEFNVLKGSGRFHASPWYELLLYNLALWVPAFGWLALPRLRALPRGNEHWALLTWLASSLAFMFVRHKELRFVLPLLPLSLLATASLLKGLEIRVAAAANALLLVVAFLLYRDPHGALVRALDAATSVGNEIRIAGSVTHLPEFYLRQKATVRISPENETNADCQAKRPGVYITADPCTPCELIREIEPGLGHRLRQHISSTQTFRYVYRCP